jgi:uncharacterized protein
MHMRWPAHLILIVLTAAMAHADNCVSATGRSVSVSGSATISAKPDRVTFSVGVETEAPNVADAFRRNSDKVNAVIAALKQHGVAAEEIQTSNFSIESRDENGKRIAGFRVSNIVSVTRQDPTGVGDLLQAAVAAGANEADGLRFFIADPGTQTARGLELAFQNARAKAERLASLSGRTLGDVVCVTDNGTSYSRGYVQSITVTGRAPEIAAGEEPIAFSVSVVFELK